MQRSNLSVYSVIVDGYNVKFCKLFPGIIKVSIPGIGCEINMNSDEKQFSASFVTELIAREWTDIAINKLQTYILSENEWSNCVKMNITTGKIKFFM